MLVKTKIRFLFFAFILAAVIFTTCDSPMGMGQPIDWEPPVLTMDPVSNPLYVRLGSELTGTVTDNVGVDRVIFVNSATGEELFPVIRDGDNWKVELLFSEEQNGEKIIAQIIAYDKMGNSGASSMAFVTLIIDIRPPVIEYIDIKRTDSRMANIEPYSVLKALETADPRGERKADLYKYQNGWFYINAIVSDEETKVEVIALDIYDSTSPNTLLLSLDIDEGYTPYFPRWTIKEEDIINAGAERFGADYKTNYYNSDARYYYRVAVKALDMSKNENQIIEENEGYICLWAKSDKPKGVIDPGVGAIVSKGTPLPVDFYDDDSLLWAYTGLLTIEQWNGSRPIASGVFIPSVAADETKLLWLKETLTGRTGDDVAKGGTGSTVYNWKYDRYNSDAGKKESEPIVEQIGTSSVDEKLVYVPTGNEEADYGDYVLFTLTADKKLDPHSVNGPEWTNKNIWAGRAERVQVIDENVPLIVFDKTVGCPEENTFPDPLVGSVHGDAEKKYFKIVGYTLRENVSTKNKVIRFRMAWIPKGMSGGPDSHITAVQTALRNNTFAGMPSGVQYWDFTEAGGGENGQLTVNPGEDQYTIPGDPSKYIKQNFSKEFSVMGDNDDLKTGTKNFTYNSVLENETKLFIFYAVDNMGHEVFRQYRLLGSDEKPQLYIYDITNKITNMTDSSYPNPTVTGNVNPSTGSPTPAYYTLLDTYNKKASVYTDIKGAAVFLTDSDLTIPFQIYPRGTVLKLWVSAKDDGKIPIQSVTMKDITFTNADIAPVIGSGYKTGDNAYTFCEYYPDVTSRTFLFEVTNKLGNTASVQRTIAVTNAARLENITTTSQNGKYGMGKVITIKANFSSQIYVNNSVKPKIRVCYEMPAGTPQYAEIECNTIPTYGSPALALEFDFVVPENAKGTLKTMYNTASFTGTDDDKRPIKLGTAQVYDYQRRDEAFIPGYVTGTVSMPNWTTDDNTLQKKKTIELDGVRPKVSAVAWIGKDGSTAFTTEERYFKTGESFELRVTADKPIRASGTSTFQYYIRDSGNTDRGPYTAEFKYQKPGAASNILIYSLTVSSTNCPYDGRLGNISLYTAGGGNIVDEVDNPIVTTGITGLKNPTTSTNIFVKQTPPAAPNATLGGIVFASAPDLYKGAVNLAIPDSTAAWAAWEDYKEYSIDGGLNWTNLTGALAALGANGTHRLQARYKDRAGNEGALREKTITINNSFPRLVSVNTVQSSGWYTAKTGKNSLTFNLNFADTVNVTTPGSVRITLKNRSGTTTTDNEYTILAANAGTNVTTVTLTWPGISAKEMKDGLYISDVQLGGLTDRYGNTGGTGTATYTSAITITPVAPDTTTYPCPNLAAGIKVDAIDPSVSTRVPAHDTAPSGNNLITQLQLTFREPVMKGSGTITIRPRRNYAIPPVLDDKEYYLGYTNNGNPATGTFLQTGIPTKNPTNASYPSASKTYISSFYDIFNALPKTPATYRNYLTQTKLPSASGNMSDLEPNPRTSQNFGPYIKTTHGLTSGYGYTGDYTGTLANNATASVNSPNLGGAGAHTGMIPDTATKWVLDYQYGITQDIDEVNKIRAALTNAKWRWKEIDVVNTAIAGDINTVVTITLDEPLLKGLEWDVYYPAGTFTDEAGNSAAACGTTNADPTLWENSDYFFTSPGVQAPVVRVNRRSYDARTSGWSTPNNVAYNAPADTGGWNSNAIAINNNNGWGIGNFNNIHYRVESESSAVKTYGTAPAVTAQYFKGGVADKGSAKGAWTGNVHAANAVVGGYTDMAWNAAATNAAGTWVLPNIIRRSRNGTDQNYTVITKNGTPESRTSTGTLQMFRSYNRDLTASDLGYPTGTGTGLTTATLSSAPATLGQGFLGYDALEANKSYIIGSATCNGQTAKGIEGVFRTVIVFNYGPITYNVNVPPNTSYNSSNTRGRYFAVQGSNIKNGMPSVAGFPVRDAEEVGDNRFNKVFFCNNETNSQYGTQFYWVSTEIVCEWYFLTWGGRSRNNGTVVNGNPSGTEVIGGLHSNGSHQNVGEINNYLSVGYGDLTYGYNINCSNMSGNGS
jgi:hypothetical protein